MDFIRMAMLTFLFATNQFAMEIEKNISIHEVGPLWINGKIGDQRIKFAVCAKISTRDGVNEISLTEIISMAEHLLDVKPAIYRVGVFYPLMEAMEKQKVVVEIMSETFYQLFN